MKYLPQLDGLRAIAVLLVLFIHAQFAAFGGGFLGVDLFFVLSGYLITSLLLREYDQHGRIDFKAFYVRRALRLLPALCVTLVLAVLMEVHRGNLTAREIVRNVLAALFYVGNWMRAFELASLSKLDHTWSLSIEEQFYLVWPLALAWLLRRGVGTVKNLPHILITLIVVIALWRAWLFWPNDFARAYYGFDTRVDEMLVGCTLAAMLHQQRDAVAAGWNKLRFVMLPLVLGAMCWMVGFTRYGQALYPLGLFTVAALGAAVLIAEITLHPNGWLARGLSTAPLRYVGKLSYGLYLYHFVIFSTTPPPIAHPIAQRQVLDFIVTFGLAALSYHCLEQPCLKFKTRWQRLTD
jgi:peptidoglycan/LPS O-acetylase OafA/YrhL